MKRIFSILLGISLLFAASSLMFLNSHVEAAPKGKKCTTIQSGELKSSTGEIITTGYDKWGYNYQAHLFNGFYENYSRPSTLVTEGDTLVMKWNDAWLSNKDCDEDGLLDRHYRYDSYIGSGAWETNHMTGTYESDDQMCHWSYFVKIVAKPTEDYECNVIWGQFCIVQEIYSDSCTEDHGISYKDLGPIGFGQF